MTNRASLRTLYFPVVIIVLLLAVALRAYALTADAPLHVSIYPGLSNDGVTTVAAARDRILFGSWSTEPSLVNLVDVLPGMAWIGYGFFSLLGIGYWQANLISVVTGILSIVFTAAFARQHLGWRTALIAALFMTTSYVYVVYNRTPIVYTTLACAMALALFTWGKGLRRPWWFAVSLFIAVMGVLFLKVLGLAILPALLIGIALVVSRRRTINVRRLVAVLIAAFLAALGIYLFLSVFVPDVAEAINDYLRLGFGRSFRLSYGLEENLRFGIQAMLQFGIYSSFFARMLPLFVISYSFVLFRIAQFASRDRPRLPAAEAVILVYTLTTALMLMFSRSQATRYTILLIPPLCLTAALAIDRFVRADHIHLPSNFGRLFPVLIMTGLAYLIYQVAAAILKLITVSRLGTGLADYRAVIDARVLFLVFGLSLAAAMILTLLFLWRVKEKNKPVIKLPHRQTRAAIAVIMIIVVVLFDMVQYFRWAIDPQYTLLQASRDIVEVVGEEAVIGGTFAYPLVMENELAAFYFVAPNMKSRELQDRLLNSGFTHIAIDDIGSPVYGGVSDSPLFEYFPELESQVRLVKTYVLRDNLVRLYEVVE